jgi:hypothetical protein
VLDQNGKGYARLARWREACEPSVVILVEGS